MAYSTSADLLAREPYIATLTGSSTFTATIALADAEIDRRLARRYPSVMAPLTDEADAVEEASILQSLALIYFQAASGPGGDNDMVWRKAYFYRQEFEREIMAVSIGSPVSSVGSSPVFRS